MIISRTPFRVSFFGGGTDYPAWYRENGGAVISTSINKYCYIICRFLPPFFDYKYRIRYDQREETKNLEEIRHPVVREGLKFFGIDRGIEMVHTGDLPARTGIGSSSSFSTGFLNTLYALKGKMVTKRQLALDAIHFEQNLLKENVGSQDQTIAAFGGFNKIEFGGIQEITVFPITLSQDKLDLLQDHLMLFFTGFSRVASEIAAEQISSIPKKKKELKTLMEITEKAFRVLNDSNDGFEDFGKLLNETWKIKQSLSSKITNSQIGEIYEAGMDAGALGGKLLGAGGGGFILFFVKPEVQPKIKEKLKKILHVPFRFENLGSQIIYYAPSDNL
ncbi:kinase [bacterium]|nr:MAG: kinase [bacterium]